jgi:hypothetical protein
MVFLHVPTEENVTELLEKMAVVLGYNVVNLELQLASSISVAGSVEPLPEDNTKAETVDVESDDQSAQDEEDNDGNDEDVEGKVSFVLPPAASPVKYGHGTAKLDWEDDEVYALTWYSWIVVLDKLKGGLRTQTNYDNFKRLYGGQRKSASCNTKVVTILDAIDAGKTTEHKVRKRASDWYSTNREKADSFLESLRPAVAPAKKKQRTFIADMF